MQWFYEREGKAAGPVTEAKLQAMADAETIHEDTLVWCEGLDDWITFEQACEAEWEFEQGGLEPQGTSAENTEHPRVAQPNQREFSAQNDQPANDSDASAGSPSWLMLGAAALVGVIALGFGLTQSKSEPDAAVEVTAKAESVKAATAIAGKRDKAALRKAEAAVAKAAKAVAAAAETEDSETEVIAEKRAATAAARAAKPSLQRPTGSIATVNGVSIDASKLNTELDQLKALNPAVFNLRAKFFRGRIVKSLINEEVVRQALTKEQLEVADAEVESQYQSYKKRLGRGDTARFATRLAMAGKTEGGLRRELHTMIGAGKIAQKRGDGRQMRKASTPSQKTLFVARLGRITLTKLKREAQIKVLLPDSDADRPADRVIAAPSSKRGKAAGSPCKYSFDCASKTCVNGSCSDGSAGAACKYNFQCTSKTCVNGSCSDKSAGAACKYNFQCTSKTCVNGSCSDGSAGAACKYNFQCTSKICVNGTCSDGRSGSACKYGFQCKDSKRCEKGRCK